MKHQFTWILLGCILTAHFTTEIKAGIAVDKRTEKEIPEAIAAVSGISAPLIDTAISLFSDPASSSAWRPMNAHFAVDSSKALGDRPNWRPQPSLSSPSSNSASQLASPSLTPTTLLGSPVASPSSSSSSSPSPTTLLGSPVSSPSSSSSSPPSSSTVLGSPSSSPSKPKPSASSNRPSASSHRPPQSGASLKPQSPSNSLPIPSPTSTSSNGQVDSSPFTTPNQLKPAPAPYSHSPQQASVSATNTDIVGSANWANEGYNGYQHYPGRPSGSQHLSMNLLANLAELTGTPNVHMQVATDSLLNSANTGAHAMFQNLFGDKDKNKPKDEGQQTAISHHHVVQLKNN